MGGRGALGGGALGQQVGDADTDLHGESGITLVRRVWGQWWMERYGAAEVFNASILHGSLACVHIFSHGQNNVHKQ